ncbi:MULTISPECIES: hypothetical protein [unclassified Streptomyces]|uniref:hypothetical protein n=1 Tax=Streptomyces sp. NPDC127532 TaxID=3345399 RepID=UPI00363C0CD6
MTVVLCTTVTASMCKSRAGRASPLTRILAGHLLRGARPPQRGGEGRARVGYRQPEAPHPDPHDPAAIAELRDGYEEQARTKAELEAELHATSKHGAARQRWPAQEVLCDLGLLPNYALIDAVTTLNATVYWPEGKTAEERDIYKSKSYRYERPRGFALSELAPGNTFYEDCKHRITGIDIVTGKDQDWRHRRFCPSCGYVRTETPRMTSCPARAARTPASRIPAACGRS